MPGGPRTITFGGDASGGLKARSSARTGDAGAEGVGSAEGVAVAEGMSNGGLQENIKIRVEQKNRETRNAETMLTRCTNASSALALRLSSLVS